MKVPLLVLLILLVLGAIAGGTWYTMRGSTTVVAAKDARQVVDANEPDTAIAPGDRPASGTWRYTGSGSDSFDALGGDGHTFPAEISAVVELDADASCEWTMHVVFVAEHLEERRMCTDGAAVSELGFARTTQFLGRRQTSEYVCTDDALRLPDGAAKGTTWTFTCSEDRGGAVKYTGTHLGEQQVEVGGTQVATTHIRIDGRQDDKSTGDEHSEYWLLPNGLPARFMTDRKLHVKTPLGSMNTTEQWDYTLALPTPSEP
ncbi:MAG: hypothetical protein ABI200_06910 [Gaiellales bacterium]